MDVPKTRDRTANLFGGLDRAIYMQSLVSFQVFDEECPGFMSLFNVICVMICCEEFCFIPKHWKGIQVSLFLARAHIAGVNGTRSKLLPPALY